jgi:GTP cyclohydrolase IA
MQSKTTFRPNKCAAGVQRARNTDVRVGDKEDIDVKNSSISDVGRKQLSSQERARFEGYMAEIFSRLGMDLDSEPCKRTPHRWVQALVDMTDGYNPNIEVAFKRECVNCAQDIPTVQIVEGPIDFASLCEHHVLPFIGQAYIGCLRHEKIIGLSKFTRIVRKYARRFTVQERIAQEVANELERIIEPHGIIVHLRARHSCTQCRGVREMGALTRTIERRGQYVSNHQLVAEFMTLVRLND